MADFSTQLAHNPPHAVVHTTSRTCLVCEIDEFRASGFTSGATWPAANRAIYLPFVVENVCTAYQMGFEVTTQSGNYDIGIYDYLGNRQVSKGSTAVPVAGIALADIADTTLVPGLYYMALCIDNTTAAVTRTAPLALWLQVHGVQQQAVGAVTLPDPATFANPSSAYLPAMMVALRATV